MSTLQKSIGVLVLLILGTVIFYQAQQISRLRAQLNAVNAQREQDSALGKQLEQEHARATNALASLSGQAGAAEKSPKELLKLRGEVGRLRVENASIASTNAISKITANPESRKMLRNQQKMGMAMIYKGFSKNANLAPEQTEKLNDLLADHILDNVDHVTQVLRDKSTSEEMNQLFAAQEANLERQVQELLGQDGLTQYQDYTRNLLSTLTTEQFKGMLSGTDEAKDQKSKQLLQLMQDEVRAALANANLPADYQLVPILNFRNIASEPEGDKSLKLLEGIYANVASQANSFLSPEELKKFEEFRTAAINNNRSALTLNRTMMAPISQ